VPTPAFYLSRRMYPIYLKHPETEATERILTEAEAK